MYLQQNKKFDWLFIDDPICLVWNTYISHSLTHSSIDLSITYPMGRLRGIFKKTITKKFTNFRKESTRRLHCKLLFDCFEQYSNKSILTTPTVKTKLWTLFETLESTGEMKLIWKFYLFLQNISEIWNLIFASSHGRMFFVIIPQVAQARYICSSMLTFALLRNSSDLHIIVIQW